MNLLILDGPASPSRGPNPSYRGTYRAHPTYCDNVPRDDEINQLFFWFLEEGGELGVVHNLSKARRYAELLNARHPNFPFEVVEAVQGATKPESSGPFLGFDLSTGYNYSLLWSGLKTPSTIRELPQTVAVLCEVVNLYFAPYLNSSGLFEQFETAVLCLQAMVSLQSIQSNLFEGGDLSDFEVVGLYLAADGVSPRQ